MKNLGPFVREDFTGVLFLSVLEGSVMQEYKLTTPPWQNDAAFARMCRAAEGYIRKKNAEVDE